MLFTWLRLSWTPLDIIFLVAFVVLLALTEYRPIWLRVKKKKKKTSVNKLTFKDIPGPRPSLPILGTRWIFSSFGPYKMHKIHEAYRDMFEEYGKVVKEETLWNHPVVNVMDRKSIEEVLMHYSKYPLRPPTEVTVYYRKSRPDRYTNLGIVNEQGEIWHNLRSVLTAELTSTKTVMRFLPEQNAVTDDFISLLRATRNENNEVHSFEEFTNRMGLEVTCTLILGRRMGFLNDKVDDLAAKLAAAVKVHFCASRDTFYGLPFWKAFPTKAYRQFAESEEVIYEIISDLVEKSQQEENDTCQTSDVQSVFVSILKAKGLDERDKKAAIIDFIAAGIRTFGNTLVFLMYLIAKHKNVQQQLHEEVSNLVPRRSSVTPDALKNATYLRACITEAFRVLPTAPCVARILETEMDICGYHLNPGTVVLCHTWMACMQEVNFENASTFKPERWLTEGSRKNNYLVAPFGSGRRMCPGKRFMEQELQIVLAKIVSEFYLEFDEDLELMFEFLLAPQGPVKLRLIDRE
ncbi:hypothetical protein RUM43_010957 [Polyplax serrata]|uniref:Cytochrome P450 n=1 Tax=Polyplax serrata TaxID=468196 RepID=A0AAN8PE04_POLSC